MSEQPINSGSDRASTWALVLHWRGIDLTRKCLLSLEKVPTANFHVLVVDNGSEENEGALLKSEFPDIHVLRLEQNQGFAGGCNAGMRYCMEQGAQFIWLLNNDTRVPADTLDILLSETTRNSSGGAFGARMVDELGSLDEARNLAAASENAGNGRGVIDFVRAKTYLKQSGRGEAIECEWLSGSNLLLRVDALQGCGLFDEQYFLYFEDTELCHRLRLAGWRCFLVPSAIIEHTGNASTSGKRRFWRDYYYTRNRLLFFSTYLTGIRKLPALAFILAHLARHSLVLPFRGEKGRLQLKAELLGARDYFKRSFGKAQCLDWCED